MKKITLAVLLSAFVAAPAFSGDFYGGINAGKASTSFDNITLSTSSPAAFGLFAGYTINPNVALEAAYVDLGAAKTNAVNIKSNVLAVTATGSYPINPDFSVYGKLGVSASTTTKVGMADANRTGVSYGLGGQYNATSVIGIRFGLDHYDLGDGGAGLIPRGKANLLSVAGLYKF